MKGLVLSLMVLLVAGMLACGGGSSTGTPTSSTVTITPTSASVATSTTQQFAATVVSTTNTAVIWQVNGIVGGNFTVGTITQDGLYTAPGTVPNPATVTVTAVSVADATQTASAKVTITAGTAIAITVAPTSATVPTGRTQQFTATVTPAANTAVTWQVNSVTGGNLTNGTISSTGVYTAPATVPSTATVTITAISQADTSKTATAQVTIVQAVNMSVVPTTAVVPAGGQQTFSATVNGQSVDVTWSLTCKAPSPGDCGSISPAGVYTAPLSPPPGGDVIVTATATSSTAPPAGAVVTVQFSPGSLNGQYAFSFGGRTAGGAFSAAGSITFDGSGVISGGIEDINSGGFSTINITGGSYQVGADGRGSATVQTQTGSETWQLALVNHARIFAIRFDSGGVTASGTLELQDPSQFNLAAVQGNYSLNLAGRNAGGLTGALAMAGALTANGGGAISSGVLDVSSAGAVTPSLTLTGIYGPPSGVGRGTLTLTSTFASQSLVYYIVDGSRLKLLETDSSPLRGDLVKQPAGPFTASGFKGQFAFAFGGSSAQGALGTGGTFTLDGAGNVSSGAMDINNAGSAPSGLAVTGSYSVTDAVTGRTTVSLSVGGSTLQYVFYPQTGGALNFMETDSANVTSGVALAQTGLAFTSASLQGHYAVSLAGTDLTNLGEEDISGQMVPNGGSALSGTVDINDNGATAGNTAVQGSYTVSATGRGTAALQSAASTLSSANLNLYLVSGDVVLLVGSDSNRVLVGILRKQF